MDKQKTEPWIDKLAPISLRDDFAIRVLHGILATGGIGVSIFPIEDAKRAYIYADAMLKARDA